MRVAEKLDREAALRIRELSSKLAGKTKAEIAISVDLSGALVQILEANSRFEASAPLRLGEELWSDIAQIAKLPASTGPAA